MSIVNSSIQLGGGTTAQIAAAAAYVPLVRQVIFNYQNGEYYIGDGVTALGGLTAYGGILGVYTAGTGLTLTGNQFSINSSVVTLTGAQALSNKTGLISQWTNDSGYLTSSTGVTTVNGSSGAITNVALTTGTLAQFAATTSAQLAGVISDETGSGALVFGTSPTFTTDITTPKIKNSSAILFDNGTSTINFTSFSLLGNSSLTVGSSASNADLVLNSGSSTGGIYFRTQGTNRYFIDFVGQISTPNLSSGNTPSFRFTYPTNTGQTASTNIPTAKWTGSTITWNAGTLSTQYFNYFSANTVAFASASTATHVANFRSDAPLAGTFATATNLYAIDCGGHLFVANSVGVPSNNPTGGGIIYVESGALKYRGSSGTITTLGLA